MRGGRGGIGWFHVSIAAMLFGGTGAFVLGFMMLTILIILVTCAGIFYGCRRLYRYAFPYEGKVNECPQELLDYWADWQRRNPGKLTPNSY
jgi:hypothetical protein